MNFDTRIDRVNTQCAKWDLMEKLYQVSPSEGTAMWVADMDFQPPQQVLDALDAMRQHGVFGYYGDDRNYRHAIADWMYRRHQWDLNPEHIFSTHGLVNAVALCLQAFTKPGDGIILFTPVYHAFAKIINASQRQLVSCELANNNGRYEMDFDAYEAQMTGNEKVMVLCSPHNPGGRVWSVAELEQAAEFAQRHDLLILSDDIHHDLTFGAKYTPMPVAVPEIRDRLVMLTAASKTFNLAAGHCGNVSISNPDLHKTFAATIAANGISVNNFGIEITQAAYTFGDAWLTELLKYLDENRKLFDQAITEIPALSSMELEATYLAWVDFSKTGMSASEYQQRVQKQARIAANHGATFGQGGQNHLRFNFALPRAQLIEALARLKTAFADLQ
ncbi:aminotransferase [Amylibacter marinus]|uniref:cysteine-S-conjugate beta-lyase n=1 Tax=Amylibacter marinus TaxID=1475483 RepID=A0ABQ5VV32_9RHOB|nr:MalY/PatB family protein [Amylibacter marinus]GLQ35061.1 aminotransferase [Amylibacter marinus]